MVSPCTLFLSLFHSHFFFNRYRIIDTYTYRYTTTNRYTTITTYTYRYIYIYFISRIIFFLCYA